MADWTTVLVAFISGAAGVTGGIAAQVFQGRREQATRIAAAFESQADRLRQDFVVVLKAARACRQIAHEMSFVFEDETVASRNERLSAALAERIKDLEDALVSLDVEPGAPDLETVARNVLSALDGLAYGMGANREHPGSVSANILSAERATIDSGVQTLRTAIRTHLLSLMPAPPPAALRRDKAPNT